MYIKKNYGIKIQLSNKLLLTTIKTQLLKVINYYCLLDFSRRPEKFFLNTITSTGTGTQSQAQAELQSQAQAQAQAAAAQLPGSGLNSNNL